MAIWDKVTAFHGFSTFFHLDAVTEVKTDIYVTSFGPVSDTDMVSSCRSERERWHNRLKNITGGFPTIVLYGYVPRKWPVSHASLTLTTLSQIHLFPAVFNFSSHKAYRDAFFFSQASCLLLKLPSPLYAKFSGITYMQGFSTSLLKI